ncbi:MAG TPA: hypothetical protein VMN39_00170 [Longimicrobiaceae bacterium]|nr:hypothetical protein [Longimicrobiaceae bacterium]
MRARRIFWMIAALLALAGAASVAWILSELGPRSEPEPRLLTPLPTETVVETGE